MSGGRGVGRWKEHLHKSLQTKVALMGLQVFQEKQMPKKQIKAQTLIPKAHCSACCTPSPSQAQEQLEPWRGGGAIRARRKESLKDESL